MSVKTKEIRNIEFENPTQYLDDCEKWAAKSEIRTVNFPHVVAEMLAKIVEGRKALAVGDINEIARCFLEVGHLEASLLLLPRMSIWQESGAKLYKEKQAREEPFRVKKNDLLAVKQAAHHYARARWEADTSQSIRLSDMCQLVWSDLVDLMEKDPVAKEHNLRESLPNKPDGLKPWLRGVAPDYAKNPGAPAKK